MDVTLETYDPQKHDQVLLAELIFRSDEEMNALTYGRDAQAVIRALLNSDESYFVPDFMKCATVDGDLVGVVVVFPACRLKEIDNRAGKGFMKAMGILSFFKKMPLYMKMEKMLGGEMDDDGLYVHTICVDSEMRGQGIGSAILDTLAEENEKMVLYVNMENEGAIRFYERNGFEKKHLGKMKHKGQAFGEYLMERK